MLEPLCLPRQRACVVACVLACAPAARARARRTAPGPSPPPDFHQLGIYNRLIWLLAFNHWRDSYHTRQEIIVTARNFKTRTEVCSWYYESLVNRVPPRKILHLNIDVNECLHISWNQLAACLCGNAPLTTRSAPARSSSDSASASSPIGSWRIIPSTFSSRNDRVRPYLREQRVTTDTTIITHAGQRVTAMPAADGNQRAVIPQLGLKKHGQHVCAARPARVFCP